MTQTTLIGGLGLAAFMFSTFTPTQRFGTLMLFLLAAALVGDLIVLPAVLASPLGKYFGRELTDAERAQQASQLRVHADADGGSVSPSTVASRANGENSQTRGDLRLEGG
jgi:hypothetical protein